MFHFKNADFYDVNSSDKTLKDLFWILKTTLNEDLTEEDFLKYLFGIHPDSLEISFIYKGEELAGFCTAAAYPQRCNGKKVVILRSAFGLRDHYKKGNFPLHGLFYKYIRYKLKHPFTPVYVAGFMANPLMYAMICKYTLTSYPRHNKPVTDNVKALRQSIVQSMDLQETAPFVMKIHFQVKFTANDERRFKESNDEDVKYFLRINPDYNKQVGVLVILPVSFLNMGYTVLRYAHRILSKKIIKLLRKNVATPQQLSTYKYTGNANVSSPS